MGHMVESSHKNADRQTQVIVDSSGKAGSDISEHMKALTDSHAELIKAVKKPRKLRHTKGKDGSYTTEALE
jgi:hypothetical protein